MATVTTNAEAAMHGSASTEALNVTANMRFARRSRAAQLWIPLIAIISLFGVAVLVHAAVADWMAGQTVGVLAEKGFVFNTNLFAGVGLLFVIQAIASHVWVVRQLNGRQLNETPGNRSAAVAPLALLAVPMATRLAATFAALAYLLVTVSASRHEAVCIVLFWYVALTTLEVAAIVWAQQPTKSLAMPNPSNTSS